MAGMTDALQVLDEILILLTDEASGCTIQPPPCRVALYPGAEVAWDTCEVNSMGDNGQLWANLMPTVNIVNEGSCATVTFQAEIGIVRCAATVDDDGDPPSPGEVAADALQQAEDADAIWRALSCCDARSEAVRSMVLTSWRPVGPQGGCVGGIWTVRGVFNECC